MKAFILALTTILIFHLQPVLAASPEEEARFVTAIKKAFDTHNGNGLIALTCWDRVPAKFRHNGMSRYVSDARQGAIDIKLVDPDPAAPDPVWKDADGVSYRSNLSVVKQLKITFTPGGQFNDGTYPVGEKNGRLYLLKPAPTK